MRHVALPASCWCPLAVTAASLLAITTTAPAVRAQEPLAQVAQRAIADLADKGKAADATTRLVNLGAASVPPLRELLHERRAGGVGQEVRAQAVYVLGSLGLHALPAVPDLRALMREEDSVVGREAVRWRGPMPGTFAAGDLGDAWLAVSGEAMSAVPARAMLDHWHVDSRRRALAWMHEHGAALPMRERADLVGRLWDVDATIVLAAARAFGAWGQEGLVALAALRHMQRNAEVATGNACGQAADAVIAACATLPGADRAWLDAIDATLRGVPATAPAVPLTRKGLEALTEVLFLAQWNDRATLDRLLSLCESAGRCRDDTVQAVLGWLTRDDAGVVDLANAWLARRGSAVLVALDEGGGDPAEALRRQVRAMAQPSNQRTGIEMLAHVLAADSTGPELTALLEDENTRVVAHALAVALDRGSPTLADQLPRLRVLARRWHEDSMVLRSGADTSMRLPIDLGDLVRAFAAIALVDLDATFEPPDDLDEVVRKTVGVPLAHLDRHIADLRETNKLPALLDRLEDQCRVLMSQPPHLRWPTLATAPR